MAWEIYPVTVLATILLINGRRSDAALLVKLTGYTIQSIRYVTGKLIEDGLIRRVPRSDNRVLWEAVK